MLVAQLLARVLRPDAHVFRQEIDPRRIRLLQVHAHPGRAVDLDLVDPREHAPPRGARASGPAWSSKLYLTSSAVIFWPLWNTTSSRRSNVYTSLSAEISGSALASCGFSTPSWSYSTRFSKIVPVTTSGSCVTALIGSSVVGPAGIATVSVLPFDCAHASLKLGADHGAQRPECRELQHAPARKHRLIGHDDPPVSVSSACLAPASAPTAIEIFPCASSEAVQPGGMTHVESYSSTMQGPLRGAAQLGPVHDVVSSQPWRRPEIRPPHAARRCRRPPAAQRPPPAPPATSPARRGPTTFTVTSSTGSSLPARCP